MEGPPFIVNQKNSFNIILSLAPAGDRVRRWLWFGAKNSAFAHAPRRSHIRMRRLQQCWRDERHHQTHCFTWYVLLNHQMSEKKPKNQKTPHTNTLQLTQVSLSELVLRFLLVFPPLCRQSHPIRCSGYTHVVYSNLIRCSPLAI